MKKHTLMILSVLFLASCGNTATSSSEVSSNGTSSSDISVSETSAAEEKVSVLAPEGTPALALANFYTECSDLYSSFDIKAGSDPLVAAFASQEYDIIVAPTNLGAKFYNQSQEYLLYQTIVWGNLYLVSKTPIESFGDISGKSVTCFGGQSATPYIVMKSLIDANSISDVTLENVDDVATANSFLMANQAEIIVSAQPSLTKILQTAQTNNIELYTIDLQEEWAALTGNSSYPQASIFFKKSLSGKIDTALERLTRSVADTIASPAVSAERAVAMYSGFETLGKDVLEAAIPDSHFGLDDAQKDAIEFYFTKMGELGLSAAYGGVLPDEGFYYLS